MELPCSTPQVWKMLPFASVSTAEYGCTLYGRNLYQDLMKGSGRTTADVACPCLSRPIPVQAFHMARLSSGTWKDLQVKSFDEKVRRGKSSQDTGLPGPRVATKSSCIAGQAVAGFCVCLFCSLDLKCFPTLKMVLEVRI